MDRAVCDLYAGIGSVGIEALSRGAHSVKFVENSPVALALLKSNLRRVDAARASVAESDVEDFLKSSTVTFDVILADPPYGEVRWDQLLKRCVPSLKSEGIFVMEMDLSAALPEGLDVRIYGRSKVVIWRQSA